MIYRLYFRNKSTKNAWKYYGSELSIERAVSATEHNLKEDLTNRKFDIETEYKIVPKVVVLKIKLEVS